MAEVGGGGLDRSNSRGKHQLQQVRCWHTNPACLGLITFAAQEAAGDGSALGSLHLCGSSRLLALA